MMRYSLYCIITYQSPLIACKSVWQHPLATILTKHSSALGMGISTFLISNLFLKFGIIAARIIFLVSIPVTLDAAFMSRGINTATVVTVEYMITVTMTVDRLQVINLLYKSLRYYSVTIEYTLTTKSYKRRHFLTND